MTGDGAARSVDVIVAGSGHNGLVAACYLAKAGLDVLVVEAHATPGGMTATNEFLPEAPGFMINEASIHASLFRTTNIDKQLGLTARHGLRMRPIDPAHVHLGYEGESIAMWRDPRMTAEEIRHFSRRDAVNYLRLCDIIRDAVNIGIPAMQTNAVRPEPKVVANLLKNAAKGRRNLGEIARWVTSSQQEVIEEWFEHDMVRGPLTGSGTHPVAGISGMPGQNCAKRVLQVLKKQDKQGRKQRATEAVGHTDTWVASHNAAAERPSEATVA